MPEEGIRKSWVLSLTKNEKTYSFVKSYNTLAEVMTSHKLSSLGDSFVNFVCSLALSSKEGKPVGIKAKGVVLAEALRKSGLREFAPSRVDSHMLADASEAILVYGWLKNLVTMQECVSTINRSGGLIEGLTLLPQKLERRLNLF